MISVINLIMSSAQASTKQLFAYVDPFDLTTHTPKIPDGKSTTSIGVGFTTRGVVNTVGGVGTYIVLIPGFTRFCFVISSAGGLFDPPDYQFGFTTDSGFSKTKVGSDGAFFFSARDSVYMWRQVSLGLRIMPISALSTINGSWESISVPISRYANDHEYSVDDWAFNLTIEYINELAALEWVNHETFKSGRLADIGDLVFSPLGRNTDHPFHEMESRMYFFDGEDENMIERGKENSISWALLREYIYDNTYDAVIVKVVSEMPVKLLLTARSNHEHVQQEGALERRYHTESERAVVTPMVAAQMKRKHTGGSHVSLAKRGRRLKFVVRKLNEKVVQPAVHGAEATVEGAAKVAGAAAAMKAVYEASKKLATPVDEIFEELESLAEEGGEEVMGVVEDVSAAEILEGVAGALAL